MNTLTPTLCAAFAMAAALVFGEAKIGHDPRVKFLRMMNDEARALGMDDTFYASASGLTRDSRSSAADLLTLTVEAMKDPRFAGIWSQTEFTAKIGGPSNRAEKVVHSFTKLPGWKKWIAKHRFLGGKSGSLWYGGTENVRAQVMVAEVDGVQYVISLMGMKYSEDPFAYAEDVVAAIAAERRGERRAESSALRALNAAGGGYAYSRTDGGDRFVSENGTRAVWPASTSKVMTLHLCLKAIADLDAPVTIAAGDIQGGSGIKCYPGDVFTWRDALTVMMLPSANTLAEAVGRTLATGSAQSTRQ